MDDSGVWPVPSAAPQQASKEASPAVHLLLPRSEMDLEDCADTLIGDEAAGIKGVSGGQKRRVCIGAELVKDPSIIFL